MSKCGANKGQIDLAYYTTLIFTLISQNIIPDQTCPNGLTIGILPPGLTG
ncbi:MAG: hypothetical protein ACXWTS_09660 [Methylococcaceae bacterium]